MNPGDYQITNGYIGALGIQWQAATESTLAEAITAAAAFNDTTEAHIIAQVEAGEQVKWQESPNYYYDHSHGLIRRRPQPRPVEMVKCDCGHTVERVNRMWASRGTACLNCYDRMSDDDY